MPLFSDAAPRFGSPFLRLQPGQTWIPPQGWYFVSAGVVNIQKYDSRAGIWRYAGDPGNNLDTSYFDGQTIRLANTSGCPVAAVVTTAGSGYTTPPTVTPSAGASVWQAIVGGAISTTASILSVGGGYLYPPVLLIEQPPYPGVQATGYTTIANGTLSAITIDNQGAGYLLPPNVAIVNDWRDTAGAGAQASVGLTGAGTVTAVLCTNHGNPITSGTVPTLAFGSGSAAATAIMDWSITSVSITTAGAGYTAAASFISGEGNAGYVTAAPAYVGTNVTTDMTRYRSARIQVTTNASGGFSAATVIDPGRFQAVPVPGYVGQTTPSTIGVLAFTMGGVASTVMLLPAQQN